MVDALVSGASALRHVGSSPILGTKSSSKDCSFFCTQDRTRTDCGGSADLSAVIDCASCYATTNIG